MTYILIILRRKSSGGNLHQHKHISSNIAAKRETTFIKKQCLEKFFAAISPEMSENVSLMY